MIRAIKEFGAYTKIFYKLLTCVVSPALYLLMYGVYFKGLIPLNVAALAGVMWATNVEIMSDSSLLGGFYKKNNSSLEFLQSSNYFKGLLRNIVLVDMGRKFLEYVVLCGVLGIVLGAKWQEIWHALITSMFTVLLIYIACLIQRHFTNWYNTYCVAVGATVVGTFTIAGCSFGNWTAYAPVATVGLAVLNMGVIAVTLVYSLQKVRDSYYD